MVIRKLLRNRLLLEFFSKSTRVVMHIWGCCIANQHLKQTATWTTVVHLTRLYAKYPSLRRMFACRLSRAADLMHFLCMSGTRTADQTFFSNFNSVIRHPLSKSP